MKSAPKDEFSIYLLVGVIIFIAGIAFGYLSTIIGQKKKNDGWPKN